MTGPHRPPEARPRGAKLSRDLIDRISVLAREGLTVRDISAQLGLTRWTVTKYLNLYGPVLSRPVLAPAKVERIVALRQAGISLQEIRATVGVAIATVSKYVREAGLAKPRTAVPPPSLMRRCQSPDCYTITSAAQCPRCRAVMYEPETTAPEPTGRPNWTGTEKACARCGDPFRSMNAKHVYCRECGEARQDQLERESYARRVAKRRHG